MADNPVVNLTEKTTPEDGDDLLIEDNTAGETKKIGYDNLKTALESDLSFVADSDFSTNGVMVRTGSGSYTNRTVTAGSSKVTVSNGDGVSGNPTIDVDESELNNINITNGAGYVTTDELVSVSANDTTPGYLSAKVTSSGGSINITEVNDAGNEDLNLEVDEASIDLSNCDNTTSGFISDITGEDFTDLADTPSSYSGEGAKLVRVNAGETGLEFVSISASDENVKVSANDTTAGYLEDKIIVSVGSNPTNILEVSTLNDTSNEDLQIQIDESKIDHDALTNFSTDEHYTLASFGVDGLTDNALMRADGSAALQDSGITIDDSDNMTGVAQISANNVVTSVSGSTPGVDITQSGTGTSLNINNSGSGDFIVCDTNAFVVDNSGNVTLSGTVDGRDVAADGTKLDGIESGADVTDETNVKSALDGATITNATIAASDKILFQDADDSDNLKQDDAQSIANLFSGTVVYKTQYVDAGAMKPATTNGAELADVETTTNARNFYAFDFDAATDESVEFKMTLPEAWDGTNIKVKFHWTDGATAGSGDVVWAIAALPVGDNDAIDTATLAASTVTDTFIATGDMHTTSATSDLTMTGHADGDMVFFRVYRDADNGSDTYTEDARLLGLTIQIGESNDGAEW